MRQERTLSSSVVAEASEPARALERPLHVPSVSSGASRRSRRRTLKAGFDVVALTVAGVAVVASGVAEAWVATAIIVCLGLLAITGQYRVLAPLSTARPFTWRDGKQPADRPAPRSSGPVPGPTVR